MAFLALGLFLFSALAPALEKAPGRIGVIAKAFARGPVFIVLGAVVLLAFRWPALYFPRLGVPGHAWSNRVAGMIETKLLDPETREVVTEPDAPGELALPGQAFEAHLKK